MEQNTVIFLAVWLNLNKIVLHIIVFQIFF